MLRLGPRSRGAFAAAGLAALALAYATTPLTAASDTAPPAADIPPVRAAMTAAAPAVAVAPRRDPFAGIPEARGGVAASATPGTAPTVATAPTLPPVPPLPPIPGIIGVLPPNAGAGRGLPSDDVRVTALIAGPHACAIVEDRSGTRLVAAGDALAADRITAIDAAGVHLAHGTVYPVSPASRPAPMAVQPFAPPFASQPAAALRVMPTRPRPTSQPLSLGGPP